jgi:hypothetical protein
MAHDLCGRKPDGSQNAVVRAEWGPTPSGRTRVCLRPAGRAATPSAPPRRAPCRGLGPCTEFQNIVPSPFGSNATDPLTRARVTPGPG